MSRKGFDIERMCRLNGKKPTVRERWTAFYRLWRLAHGHGACQDMDASDCFRVLFPTPMIHVLDHESEGTLSRVHCPMFLRRRILESERRRRLYGNHPEWSERDKRVAAKVREEDGMEVTPDEVANVRNKVIRLIRDRALTEGIALPHDDDELLLWMKQE